MANFDFSLVTQDLGQTTKRNGGEKLKSIDLEFIPKYIENAYDVWKQIESMENTDAEKVHRLHNAAIELNAAMTIVAIDRGTKLVKKE